ncbi:MAG: sensor domain-containing diguanylate cyclase [Candidatus Omnitrophica bacterium]|nr:sensor domain-containing diguanylate cyclase [Candidatus Omnitrophota bacterium]
MFTLSFLAVLVLAFSRGVRSGFAGAILLSGCWWFYGMRDERAVLLWIAPVLSGFLQKMKTGYRKEAESCLENVQKLHGHLEEKDRGFQNEIGFFEKRLLELSRLYEITRDLGRALDLQGLFQQLGEILYQTLGISGCWFVQLKTPEPPAGIVYRLDRIREREIRALLDSPGLFENEIAQCRQREGETGIRVGTRTLFPLRVENQLKGILAVDSAVSPLVEPLSIIAGQLALNLEKVELYNRVQELAILDGLTGAYGRRYFLERLQEEFVRSRKQELPLSLLMCDLDYFKEKNDTYGHLVGDEVLRAVAKILKQYIREVDLLGRYGGEEFTVILPETMPQKAWQVGERIRSMVQDSELEIYDEKIRVTISIGVSALSPKMSSVEELIDQADRALYSAKTKGRNRVEVYE